MLELTIVEGVYDPEIQQVILKESGPIWVAFPAINFVRNSIEYTEINFGKTAILVKESVEYIGEKYNAWEKSQRTSNS